MKKEPSEAGKIETMLVHSRKGFEEETAVSPPLYLSSTYRINTPEEGAEFSSSVGADRFYSRYGTPNNTQLRELLAKLEGAEDSCVFASGMAAISALFLGTLKQGDHLLAQKTHYTGALSLMTEVLPGMGVEVTQVDQSDTQAFEKSFRKNTRLLYLESPSNPTLTLSDLAALAGLARSRGVLSACDNTFASSFNQKPHSLGVDLVVHSATKVLNGHSDVTAGVMTGTKKHMDHYWNQLRMLGGVLHPFDSWLLRRGLQSYALRVRQHNENAMRVAEFLEENPKVEKVYYPGLKSHPQHDLAREQMTGGFGGILSFRLKSFEAALRLFENTKLCTPAVSLGGVETLIVHPASMIFGKQSPEERQKAGIDDCLIRISVGIEHIDDILSDLDQALAGL